MNAEQVRILSERIVSEVFYQTFLDDVGEAGEGVAFIGRPKLSDDELSRRLDAAVTLSTEKLNTISPDS
ncbi:hypothetical protein [Pseudomonas mohnii]